ncbi:hypothetical protein HDU76_005503 [Blyttiomyces sp. JEL0837]|nr:hypothetical protein HDU76_005503 [Blyttiomyces sp. JEL0837]
MRICSCVNIVLKGFKGQVFKGQVTAIAVTLTVGFLNNENIIGGAPRSTTDCNNIATQDGTTNGGYFPGIPSSVCTGFSSTIKDIMNDGAVCPSVPGSNMDSARTAFLASLDGYCKDSAFVGDLAGKTGTGNVINVTADARESIDCGYGYKNNNETTALVAAYNQCYYKSPEPCCFSDPVLKASLESSTIIPRTSPSSDPSNTCNITFNRFFIMSCASVVGIAFTIILVIASIVILFWVISKQDKAAMAATKSGQFQKQTAWIRDWFRNSPLGNTAATSKYNTARRSNLKPWRDSDNIGDEISMQQRFRNGANNQGGAGSIARPSGAYRGSVYTPAVKLGGSGAGSNVTSPNAKAPSMNRRAYERYEDMDDDDPFGGMMGGQSQQKHQQNQQRSPATMEPTSAVSPPRSNATTPMDSEFGFQNFEDILPPPPPPPSSHQYHQRSQPPSQTSTPQPQSKPSSRPSSAQYQYTQSQQQQQQLYNIQNRDTIQMSNPFEEDLDNMDNYDNDNYNIDLHAPIPMTSGIAAAAQSLANSALSSSNNNNVRRPSTPGGEAVQWTSTASTAADITYIAKMDYRGVSENGEVELLVGDKVLVREVSGDGVAEEQFAFVVNKVTGEEGWCPMSVLVKMGQERGSSRR